MSDPLFQAMRELIRESVAHDVLKATEPLKEEIRSLKTTLETRSAPQGIAGPPGPKGDAGERGADGKNGVDGKDGAPGTSGKDGAIGERGADGKDGAPSTVPGPKGDTGERGADGIATREELASLVAESFADVQVRSFADLYQGVYKPDTDYTRSTLVTWGGSLFLALANTRARPEQSPDWRLVVKRGADAKR